LEHQFLAANPDGQSRRRRSVGKAIQRSRRSPPRPESDSVACRMGARHSAAGLAWPPPSTSAWDAVVVYRLPSATL
jgi:hypothetical protein